MFEGTTPLAQPRGELARYALRCISDHKATVDGAQPDDPAEVRAPSARLSERGLLFGVNASSQRNIYLCSALSTQ